MHYNNIKDEAASVDASDLKIESNNTHTSDQATN